MVDITMCMSEGCRLRETCKRHVESGTSPDNHHQSWANFETDEDSSSRGCSHYYPIKDETRNSGWR